MPRRGRVVFILGAGASAESGGPLMGNFLDVAEGLLAARKLNPEEAANFQRVFKAIAGLHSVYAKSTLDLDNIESVFAAFEMSELLGFDWACKDGSITQALRSLIVTVLDKSVRWRCHAGELRPTGGYKEFAHVVDKLTRDMGLPVTVVTFNYDLAVDFCMASAGRDVNYCLDAGACSQGTHIRLLKLHGSMNWFRSHNGGDPRIGFVSFTKLMRQLSVRDRDASGDVPMSVFDHVRESARAEGLGEDPCLVPPTWSKGEFQKQFQHVWQAAAKDLSEAAHVVIMGYSLPESDYFFRSLFALGTMGETRLKKILVVDPATASADSMIESRYRRLLGPLAEKRFSCREDTFSAACRKLTGLEEATFGL